MSATTPTPTGKVTTTITLVNRIDQILADRGFIPHTEIRSVTLEDVLVDTGATRLCLSADVVSQLGLPLQGEVDVKIAIGVQKVRTFRELSLTVLLRYRLNVRAIAPNHIEVIALTLN